MPDVIEAHSLTKVYDGGVQVSALRGVDLNVAAGTFVAIMGPSGSGKSTLLHILGVLEVPTSGQIALDGTDLRGLDDEARAQIRRQRIGFVFQQFNLLPIFTALENVALPLRLGGLSPEEAAEQAIAALEMVGMAGRRQHLPSLLSGGEQQRVAIARALVTRPAMILADEPTGSLDTANGQRVIALLRNLVDERRQTVVMVTHDPSVAACTDRVVSLRDGVIESDFDPRQGMPVTACLQERQA
jgi:putative ABC transport system ATP-binding protein